MTRTTAVLFEVDENRIMILALGRFCSTPVAVSMQLPIEKICPMLVTCIVGRQGNNNDKHIVWIQDAWPIDDRWAYLPPPTVFRSPSQHHCMNFQA